ncbi:CsbD family protein [Methylorubrum suomiense]|uniref:CsbD-like domain-containing protein n=2 Tax=Methylobacteriaceae TaxID=119045 RepID=A0ABQ4V2K1_9HYPH|nr:hypothetical protein BGCPKDLD_5223 [Methylorubrum suomiense]
MSLDLEHHHDRSILPLWSVASDRLADKTTLPSSIGSKRMSSLRTTALRGVLLGLALAVAGPALADDTPTTAGAVDRLKGLTNEAIGSAKRGVGNLTEDEDLKAEGRAQKLRGQAQQERGKVKDTIENAIDK